MVTEETLMMVNCFYYDKSPFFDFELELVNTIPEVCLSTHANILNKLQTNLNSVVVE